MRLQDDGESQEGSSFTRKLEFPPPPAEAGEMRGRHGNPKAQSSLDKIAGSPPARFSAAELPGRVWGGPGAEPHFLKPLRTGLLWSLLRKGTLTPRRPEEPRRWQSSGRQEPTAQGTPKAERQDSCASGPGGAAAGSASWFRS